MILNLPTFKYRRTRGDLIEAYKIIHSDNFHKMFTLCSNHTRGRNYKLTKEYYRLVLRRQNYLSHRNLIIGML